MSRPAAVLVCASVLTVAGCGGGAAPATEATTPGVVEPAAQWCPESGERRLATEDLIGLPLPAAERLAAEYGCTVREVERDGEPLPATMDFLPTRINVAVEEGVVTKVTNLG